MAYAPRLQTHYEGLKADLKNELGLRNANQVPKIEKIVVNIGQGEAVQNIKLLEAAVKDLEIITGQKALMTRARKKVSPDLSYAKARLSAVV